MAAQFFRTPKTPLLALLCWVQLSVQPALSGRYLSQPQQTTPSEILNECWKLFSSKKYDEAEKQLLHLIQLQPTFIDSARGSAWYLLGELLLKNKHAGAAFDSLSRGLEVLKTDNLFDLHLAGAFTKLAIQLEKEKQYEQVTDLFYQILVRARLPRNEAMLARLYEQSKFLLSPEQQKEFEKMMEAPRANRPPGQLLRQFWRGRDATPATLLNERLIEHLQRVEHALKFYANSIPRGFDDRGMIYVKLGKPSGTASAGISGRDIRSNYSFKANEVWFYNFIDPDLYFPFVHLQDKRGYVLVDGIEEAISGGTTANKWRSLVPRIASRDSLGRSGNIGLTSDTPEIDTRIYFYKQLAVASPLFYERVNELEDLLLQRQYEPSPLPATYYTQMAVSQMISLDFREESFREQMTPVEVTNILAAESLPLVFRTARFLEPDGSTRVEIYLGLRKRDLVLKENYDRKTIMLKMSATVEDATFWPVVEPQTAIVLPTFDAPKDSTGDAPANKNAVVEALTVKVNIDTFYVSGEVGGWLTSVARQPQLALSNEDSQESYLYLNSEKLMRLASFRSSQLTALLLDANLNQHFMSDLQISRQIQTRENSQATSKDDLIIEPYPFYRVERRHPLFLYFEIYELTTAEDGATRYRIAYEAEQINKKKNIWTAVKSLLRKKPSGFVELASDYIGNSKNIIEWISLDLSALAAGPVKLSVTVTDLRTKKVSKRSVDFDLL